MTTRFPSLFLAAAGLLATDVPMAFEANGFPEVIHDASDENARKKYCKDLRALKPSEIARPWRNAITHIEIKCERIKGVDDAPDVNTDTRVKLKLGAVTVAGIPVIELRLGRSVWGQDFQYVLDGRYAKLREKITAWLYTKYPGEKLEAPPLGVKGIYMRTGEAGGMWFHADPKNPARSILADAWSE